MSGLTFALVVIALVAAAVAIAAAVLWYGEATEKDKTIAELRAALAGFDGAADEAVALTQPAQPEPLFAVPSAEQLAEWARGATGYDWREAVQ